MSDRLKLAVSSVQRRELQVVTNNPSLDMIIPCTYFCNNL